MLAGNVTAQLLGTTLLIRGDNLANGIALFAGATAGTLEVVGSPAGGSNTTINGIAADPGTGLSSFAVTGRVTNILIDAGKGDDAISLVGLAGAPLNLTTQTVTILGGAGDDTVTVNDVNARNVTIDTGSGGPAGENVIIGSSTFTSGVTILTGNADDIVSVSGSTFNIDLVIVTNRGTDSIAIGEAAAPVSIRGSLIVTGGADLDVITVASTGVGRDMVLNAGDGGSAITVNTVTVGGVATILGGNGADTINLSGLSGAPVGGPAGNGLPGNLQLLTVVTGAGIDNVSISGGGVAGAGLRARDAVFDLGLDDDALIFSDSIVTGRATFIGGPGTNSLTRTNNTIAAQTVILFQTVV
jgi:hypothetical protein